jgi:hypothetical protein
MIKSFSEAPFLFIFVFPKLLKLSIKLSRHQRRLLSVGLSHTPLRSNMAACALAPPSYRRNATAEWFLLQQGPLNHTLTRGCEAAAAARLCLWFTLHDLVAINFRATRLMYQIASLSELVYAGCARGRQPAIQRSGIWGAAAGIRGGGRGGAAKSGGAANAARRI